jgi:hypothetical protein
MTNFYTYIWLREDGSPYYVGKGKNSRAYYNHGWGRAPNDRSRIKILYWPDEATAYAYEQYQIHMWGRKDLGTGCLRNLTDGGPGMAGAFYSEQARLRMGKSRKGRKHSEAARQKISLGHIGIGHPVSEKTKEKLRLWNTGRKMPPCSEETRIKISLANKGRGHLISEETKVKIRLAKLGKKHSEETRAKMSVTQSARRQHERVATS